MWSLALLTIATMIVTMLVAKMIIVNAAKLNLMYKADRRSMHVGQIANGGGLGIVIAGTFSGIILAIDVSPNLIWIVALSVCLGLTGFFDDMLYLPPSVRLLVHVTACIALIGIYAPLANPFSNLHLPPLLLAAVAVLIGMWWINLFNFMDGIDGLAASESVFILGVAVVATITTTDLPAIGVEMKWMITITASCLAFMYFNWPPARVFMGDTSSTYLPFVIFAMAIATIQQQQLTYPFWLIVTATFTTDATITLLRRIWSGDNLVQAHRSHAYQKLSLRTGSHVPVLLLYNAINIFWLAPLALTALIWPDWAWPLTIIAYGPLIILAIMAKAGVSET